LMEPYLSEAEVRDFKARMDATVGLGRRHGVNLVSGNIEYNPLQVILAISTERLDKSSKMLNRLTMILTALTFILLIVGVFNIIVFLMK